MNMHSTENIEYAFANSTWHNLTTGCLTTNHLEIEQVKYPVLKLAFYMDCRALVLRCIHGAFVTLIIVL